MRILVLGGTGKTGSAALSALRESGIDAVAGARSAQAMAGGRGVRVDVRNPAALEATARGFDAAYLLTPIGPDEAETGVEAVRALRRAGVRKIVYLAIQNLETMRAIPHFETKIPICEEVLRDGRSVVLAANFFMDNDAMLLGAILSGGVYPLPVGSVGVWSIASGDIGAAAANALSRDDWNGRTVALCGPERQTGESLAANWAAVTGRPVVYGGDDVTPFLRATGLPSGWLRDDMEQMFLVTQRLGCVASGAQMAESVAIIGRAPTRHRDFIRNLLDRSR
jgi:uncharacterized protein YbjT (DUF2867 family)